MRFPYLPCSVPRPVYPLAGSQTRYYPVVFVGITGGPGTASKDGLIDSGADDTVLPLSVARQLGIDLTNAPVGEARQVGGGTLTYRFASVDLRISDGAQTCEWRAIVGFLDLPLRWLLLGQTGFLQYFDVTFYGASREVEILPNTTFPGRHTIHRPVTPAPDVNPPANP